MKRPAWARMKVRFYLATCWASGLDDECPEIEGVNWFHDKLLFVCIWFHNYFIQPFFPTNVGFPLVILEQYED